jgi:virginiamycin B lyase
MHWNSSTSSTSSTSVSGRPLYVPATALSVSVTVDGGTPQILSAPNTTLQINAPVGTDTFVFQTYDETNGQGNVLSQATVTQTIVNGQSNHISAVLNGIVVSINLSIATPNFPAGTSTTTAITAAAMDADGNAIVGSGNYQSPIVLSISDPNNTGTLSLSSATITSPSGSSNLVYNGGTLVSAYVLAQSGGAYAQAPVNPTPTAYEFLVACQPQYIAQKGANAFFVTDSNNTIVELTRTGAPYAIYSIPTSNSGPQGIIYAEDGNLWFTEYTASKVTRMTPTGTFTENGTLFASDEPELLTDRGDGTVWYTGYGGNHIGYVAFAGGAAETTLPTGGSGPWGIAEGPDGNLYVSENINDHIAYLPNLFATIEQTAIKSGSYAEQMVKGPDGNLWFTATGHDEIGKLNPYTQAVTYYPTYSPSSEPVGITVGADGALWYTEAGLDRIGRITTSGVTSEYSIPSSNTNLKGIVGAADGSIWFIESNTCKVGRLVL